MMPPTPPLGSPQEPPEVPRDSLGEREASPWSKRWLLLAIAIAVVALAYGIGRFQGALALKAVEQGNATDRQAWQASLGVCETDRSLLEARRSLSLVALSLDRRNFGVAENHRQDALRAFEQPSLRGVTEASELGATVRALNLAVDPDPGAKREQVIAVSEALDSLVVARAGVTPVAAASAVKSP
jgi:hypothetical protein